MRVAGVLATVGLGLAAAFDEEMHHRVASAIGDEARAKYEALTSNDVRQRYTGLTYWSPNINIYRDPRWGRGQETYGEDPLLTARLGVAFVKGLQGDDPHHLKVAACAKHFAVHSGPEGQRHVFDAVVGERDLRDTYLPAFKALVDAGVEIVMGAYNRVNGEPCCAHTVLMEHILRGEWGFKGHYTSDCWAIKDFHTNHKVTQTPEESTVLAVRKGCDLNCGCTYEYLLDTVKQGLLSEADIDTCARRLLRTWFRLGMFDPAERVAHKQIPESIIRCEKHQDLSEEAARKSVVLLKNSGILPLKPDLRTLFVCGPNAASIDALIGNYYGVGDRMVTFIEGLTEAVGNKVRIEYRPGCLISIPNVNPIDWTTGDASGCDVAVACLGLTQVLEGEEGDAIASAELGDRFTLEFPPAQLEFLRRLKSRGAKIVLVVTGGSPMLMSEVHELADAILWSWYPGERGGKAVADLITGKANPSGRLPITFPERLEDLPAYANYDMTGRTYRYSTVKPFYPFGYGLSYGKVSYSGISVSDTQLAAGGTVEVSIQVSLEGALAGDEVVQVYTAALEAPFTTPIRALKAFRRVHLEPGQTSTVRFALKADDFLCVDSAGKPVLPPGRHRIEMRPCAHPERGSELGLCMGQAIEIQIHG